MLRNSIISLFVLLSFFAEAQVGNEWIDFSQSYYKFKVKDEGLYRITRQQLQAAGFPLESVPKSRIQLFREGNEIALNVNTGNEFEWLEFYGYGKDGTLDASLYEANDQPHTFYSLFTDSASYFLTYKLSGSESGKRMNISTDRNTSGLTPESYHIEDTIQLFTSSYAPGVKFGSGAEFSLSKYDEGEGWTGGFLSKNNSRDYSFILENYVSSGVNPILETVLIGGNSLNHNAAIQIGENTGSLSALDNVEFPGWGKQQYSGTFSSSNVGAGGEFVARLTAEGFPGAAERFSIAYMRLMYPQSFDLGSRSSKIFTLSNPTNTKALLQISTNAGNEIRAFDVSNPNDVVRLATTPFSDRVEVVVPAASNGDKLLVTTNFLAVGDIQAVSLPDYNLSSINYLIITHPDLRNSGDPVADYENYRESEAGGSYEVQVSEIDDLYNLYSYGDPTPQAIRNFIIDANNQNTLAHVFLIGKGFTPNFNFYRGSQSEINIPTYGFPGSDLMFTLGIGTDSNVPGIPVGRLNAKQPSNVTAYLQKIIEMEAQPFDDLWRKDFLQLSGGATKNEIDEFRLIVKGFTDILENDFIGGKAFNTSKESGQAVEFIDVTDRVNQGVGYITFFGHSSGTTTDIEIGNVSNPSFGFSNQAKYPIFLVNGCQAGEIYGTNVTFGEDWMVTPNLGAVAFMAHSNVALSSTLKKWSDLFYNLGFGDDEFIGKSLGDVLMEVSQRYFDQNGSGSTNLTQLQQMTLQGDPAYRIFGADHPDYSIDNNSLSASGIDAQEILATQDSFKIDIVVRNYGRTTTDSLAVRVNRTLPNGQQETYTRKFLRPLRQDTLVFYIQNDPLQKNDGTNLFTVLLDPEGDIEELSEVNNSANLDVSIFRGNTVHLYPIDNGVLAENEVEFLWQSSNLLEDSRSYDLEIDTQSDFSSPNNRKFTSEGEVLINQNFDFTSLALADTSTIYWRTRYTTPGLDETNEWVVSSFTIISASSSGWGQFEADQIEEEIVSGIRYDELSNRWEFVENTTPIDIFTFGADNAVFSYEDLRAVIGGVDLFVTSNPIDPFCETNTFNAIAFDRETSAPYRPIQSSGDVSNREICGLIPQRIYQFREQDMLGEDRRFQVMTDNMQDGDMMVMFNIGNVNYSNWDAPVITILESFGVSTSTISSLEDGQPVIFLGRKGDDPGTAIVITDSGTPIPRREQSIDLQDDVIGKFVSGEIRSRRIGPSADWGSFSFNIIEEVNDDTSIEVFGVDNDGNLTTLESRARAETIDISSVDPLIYPQIELSFSLFDDTDQTPAQLDYWEVNYEYPSEGILLPANKEVLELLEGQEISRSFHFFNISNTDFSDSLSVMSSLVNANGTIVQSSFQIAPPLVGDTTTFDVTFPSFDMAGFNSVLLEVSANENEVYTSNNRLVLNNVVEIQEDETNPILDITFDGFHILDGDVVSPNPNIAIRIRDENPFVSKTDTVGINISLRLPGEESQFERINFSDTRLNYTPASENQDFQVEFTPGPLEDGIYAIQVQGEDEAGNQSGKEPYEVSFEVINESTITHFYPYPNPFSTSCRFVFTLTGTEIPNEIKIQILTVSGRVVREITQDEIGPIRIGNNITSYAWDGRDENGDQLANGVYFYKVFVNSGGNQVQQRTTSADKAFKNGFGKLYILR